MPHPAFFGLADQRSCKQSARWRPPELQPSAWTGPYPKPEVGVTSDGSVSWESDDEPTACRGWGCFLDSFMALLLVISDWNQRGVSPFYTFLNHRMESWRAPLFSDTKQLENHWLEQKLVQNAKSYFISNVSSKMFNTIRISEISVIHNRNDKSDIVYASKLSLNIHQFWSQSQMISKIRS